MVLDELWEHLYFLLKSGTISVEYEDGESDILPNKNVLIATGSSPRSLPFINFDHQQILSVMIS